MGRQIQIIRKRMMVGMCLVLIVSSSCFGGKRKPADDVKADKEVSIEPPYSINLEKILSMVTPVKLSEVAGEIRYVPLETSESCLLKRVHELAFFNNTILVSDFSNLFQFDDRGKFIKTIGQNGNGPRDYVNVNSIVNDDIRNILNVFTSGKVNRYDKDMNYLESIRLVDRYYGGLTTPWGSYFMYLSSSFKLVGDTSTVYSFAEIDTSAKVIGKIPNPSPIVSIYRGMIYAPIPFYKYEETVRYMDYGNDTLFTFSENGDRRPYAICNLGSMKREVDTHGFTPGQMEELSSKVLMENVCEDDRYLYLTLRWGVTDNMQYILFDKRNGEIRNVGKEGMVNDLDGGIPFFPRFIREDGTKVMYVDAEYVLEKAPSGDLASDLKPDDNPVLVLVN